ncbi:MAG TPA: glycosyltransferase [Propionibacteriaceae bacterium]
MTSTDGSALSPTDLPRVSVIFPTYNRADVVRRTIEHFQAQDYPAELLEILVADNSSDETPDMVREVGRDSRVSVRLLSSSERLPAVKRNQALREAQGDLVIFMNDDVWVRPDFVATHVRTHQAHAEPVAVVGHVEQSSQMPPTAFIQWYRPFAYDEIADRAGQTVGWQHHWSMNLSLPRQVMLDRNLVFHEEWAEIGHEDVELGYRWSKAGYDIIYEPAAWGEHYHPHDLASGCRLQASIGRGLRDLEVLIPEPGLHERYGVLTSDASPRGRVRMAARLALFNRFTAPPLERALGALDRRSRFAEWCYWKLMLRHTQLAYTTTAPRRPTPTATWSLPTLIEESR